MQVYILFKGLLYFVAINKGLVLISFRIYKWGVVEEKTQVAIN